MLTHFMPLISFDTPCKHQKTSFDTPCKLQGLLKEISGMKWVKYLTVLNVLLNFINLIQLPAF